MSFGPVLQFKEVSLTKENITDEGGWPRGSGEGVTGGQTLKIKKCPSHYESILLNSLGKSHT